jgi:hypothetical protein
MTGGKKMEKYLRNHDVFIKTDNSKERLNIKKKISK